MELIYGTTAAIVGAALGWVQFRILRLAIAKAKWWLIAVKLPLWVAFMLAAAAISVMTLAVFVFGATVTFLACGCVYWRKQNKGV